MNELLLFGINEEEIKEINEKSNVLKEVTDKEIKDRINLLREINCEDKIIKNIIISNPDYLNRSVDDILKLIKKLLELNIERIDITFDGNPWLLNKDDFEIDEFIKDKKESGMDYEDILDLIDSGMVD